MIVLFKNANLDLHQVMTAKNVQVNVESPCSDEMCTKPYLCLLVLQHVILPTSKRIFQDAGLRLANKATTA